MQVERELADMSAIPEDFSGSMSEDLGGCVGVAIMRQTVREAVR